MFIGSITALVTPFTPSQEVDWLCLARLIDHQIGGGTSGIVVGGTTGEGPTLTQEELEKMIRFTRQRFDGTVIANVGTNCTRTTLERAHIARNQGADGILAIVPYYNKPTEEGIYRHFAALEEVQAPVILYHHPGRTGIQLSLATLKRLFTLTHITALKESSGDTSLCHHFPTLCGLDTQIQEYLESGAQGTISVIGNLLPQQWFRVVCQKDWDTLNTLKSLLLALELEVNPQPIKCALELAGLAPATCRLPLIEAQSATHYAIEQALQPFLHPATT